VELMKEYPLVLEKLDDDVVVLVDKAFFPYAAQQACSMMVNTLKEAHSYSYNSCMSWGSGLGGVRGAKEIIGGNVGR
jgi:hypothetical protein